MIDKNRKHDEKGGCRDESQSMDSDVVSAKTRQESEITNQESTQPRILTLVDKLLEQKRNLIHRLELVDKALYLATPEATNALELRTLLLKLNISI